MASETFTDIKEDFVDYPQDSIKLTPRAAIGSAAATNTRK